MKVQSSNIIDKILNSILKLNSENPKILLDAQTKGEIDFYFLECGWDEGGFDQFCEGVELGMRAHEKGKQIFGSRDFFFLGDEEEIVGALKKILKSGKTDLELKAEEKRKKEIEKLEEKLKKLKAEK